MGVGSCRQMKTVILAAWLHLALFGGSCGGWRQGWGICGAGDTAHSPPWSKPAVLQKILIKFTLSWCKMELLYLKCLQSQQAQLTWAGAKHGCMGIQGRTIIPWRTHLRLPMTLRLSVKAHVMLFNSAPDGLDVGGRWPNVRAWAWRAPHPACGPAACLQHTQTAQEHGLRVMPGKGVQNLTLFWNPPPKPLACSVGARSRTDKARLTSSTDSLLQVNLIQCLKKWQGI